MRKLLLAAALIVPASLAQAETDAGQHSALTASSASSQVRAQANDRSDIRAERLPAQADRGQNGAR